ncbi:MAG: hypothetical protein ABIP03_14535 [Aquihabitans sp.]
MTTTAAVDTPLHTEILDFVWKAEKAITHTGRKLGEAACELMPGDGGAVGKLVDQTFDFTDSILDSQRDFAASVLDNALGDKDKKPTPATAKAK